MFKGLSPLAEVGNLTLVHQEQRRMSSDVNIETLNTGDQCWFPVSYRKSMLVSFNHDLDCSF